ncbi:ribonuclease H-like domain-containing protein [Tanacetum coccineum]
MLQVATLLGGKPQPVDTKRSLLETKRNEKSQNAAKCLVLNEKVVNDYFCEARVVHLLLLFEGPIVNLFESIEDVMLVYRILELMHVHFRDIRSDEKWRIAWSECNSIQNDLKCGFYWCQSTRDSSIAFFDIKPILLGNKLKIKLGLLSSDGRYDSAKICHIQFTYKQIYIEQTDILDHEKCLLM